MPKYFPLKAFGFELQVPRWILGPFAVVLFIAATWTVYQKVYSDPERVLISLKDANKQLTAEVEEYSLHAMEEPEKHELFEEADGKLLLRVFKDHCVLIQRQTSRGVRSKLVMDLAKGGSTRRVDPLAALFPVLEAAQACNRGCKNPHPGDFKWWYGKQDGQWIEVWRQWPEGCTHVQMFNTYYRTWDSNPDGTPRVRWTCCVH
jgi:hypothetical protein